ncbi:MAG: hypothetical protein NC328_05940 [Muribaculum sp.]|nr:hypothetical protein [Muribaculum sp.]
MQNKTLLLGAALLMGVSLSAAAAQVDRTEQILEDNVTFVYFNDLHDDGSYWPNWQFQFADENAKTLGESARLTYSLKKATEDINGGTLTPSYFSDNAINFYSSEGVLAAGDYTIECTLHFYNGEEVSKTFTTAPVSFSVADRSNLPAANLTYTLKPGSANASLEYTITLANVDAEGATARVWADIPGNVTVAEANGLTGTLLVDVSAGNVQAWVKGQVTLRDGTVMTTNPNDFALVFEKELSADTPVISLSCSNPNPLTATTGTVDYEITGTNLDNLDYIELFVVTTGDKPVSATITTKDLNGTIALYDLNEKAVTELWVKARAYSLSGEQSELVQYPGEAQGWTGLSVDTTNTAADVQFVTVENLDVFSIDGRLVSRNMNAAEISNLPAGLYIAGGKKVLVK